MLFLGSCFWGETYIYLHVVNTYIDVLDLHSLNALSSNNTCVFIKT